MVIAAQGTHNSTITSTIAHYGTTSAALRILGLFAFSAGLVFRALFPKKVQKTIKDARRRASTKKAKTNPKGVTSSTTSIS